MARVRSLSAKVVIILLIVALPCLAVSAIAVLPNTALVGWLAMDHLDRKGLPCEQLPTAGHVRQVLDEHQAEWRQVQRHSDWVQVETERCPGRADLAIYYPTEPDKARIKHLIGDSFFGIPYRMVLV